jgi:hypothetical protein
MSSATPAADRVTPQLLATLRRMTAGQLVRLLLADPAVRAAYEQAWPGHFASMAAAAREELVRRREGDRNTAGEAPD